MGGRPVSTGTQAQRERQARYRARLSSTATPEADDIDRAVYGSLLDATEAVAHGQIESPSGVISAIVGGALKRLKADGYDKGRVRDLLLRRLRTAPRGRRA